ncbi:MAG TPA: glycoside hydrolase family 9 protein [Candidatus Baltobacteraceae bacterium]|nr:glycoside hydrolase family 9 protein [Candidatus Baltobacteraceae bacterium]
MLAGLLLAAWTLYPKNDALSVIRVNLLGYTPARRKVAVLCSLQPRNFARFLLVTTDGRARFRGIARPEGPYGPCISTYRLDFSRYERAGAYRIVADGIVSPAFTISTRAYDGVADTLLNFMRDERSGYNPLFHAYVHQHDGIDVENGKYYDVRGGWADAADELQYVDTSATATFNMMLAYRDYPRAFANGGDDVLSEIRHGLDWLVKMYPQPGLMFNQLGDDRDHRTFHVFTDDDSDYGWGKGGARPIYPCTGRPQGLFKYKNQSTGIASTAGKFASAFALGAQIYARRAPAFAQLLARKARQAYQLGQMHPGVCQTAPATTPYYYAEADYADDMELAAAELYSLTKQRRYLHEAVAYAAMQPVKPWMGADVAEHYQWYPFLNAGHYELWRLGDRATKARMIRYYREGLERVAARAQNPFRIGFPFIWVSNDLAIAYATQAYLYRRMSGDRTFEPYEDAARSWLFGENLWGTSFVIGVPPNGPYPRHPQSIENRRYGIVLRGAVVDGPVYRTVFEELKGIKLERPDPYAKFNTGFAVYHDDFWDYSTNEPVMSTTADLVYLTAALAQIR